MFTLCFFVHTSGLSTAITRWDSASCLRASSHVCHVRVPRPAAQHTNCIARCRSDLHGRRDPIMPPGEVPSARRAPGRSGVTDQSSVSRTGQR
eukprot:5478937-Prymnesium_polylepis.1